jgi:hypothetical protein
MQSLGTVLKFLLIVSFSYAGVAKIISWSAFRQSVRDLGGSGVRTSGLIAATVITLELGVSLSLLLDTAWTSYAYATATFMLLIFSAVLWYAIKTRPMTICNCFGRGNEAVSGADIVRNLVLVLAALGAAAIDPATMPARDNLLALLIAGIGCAIVVNLGLLVRTILPDLASTHRAHAEGHGDGYQS